jgi:hypothetical protein
MSRIFEGAEHKTPTAISKRRGPKFLLRDNDTKFGRSLDAVATSIGSTAEQECDETAAGPSGGAMHFDQRHALALVVVLLVAGCGRGPVSHEIALSRRFPDVNHPGVTLPGCPFASPLLVSTQLVVADSDGIIRGLDPATGALSFSVTLPAPAGEQAFVVATPALVGDRLIVAYHTIAQGGALDVTTPRLRHRLAAVDLSTHALDPALPAFDFSAAVAGNDGAMVTFLPAHQMARGEVKHVTPFGSSLGRVYVTFGNVRDLQPWHGWLFEVDLDAWRRGAAPITASLTTTADSDCGPENSDGAREQLCGGGLWSPSGPLIVDQPDGNYEVIVSPGNGRTDPRRADFANTLMRVPPGLHFDPGCDATACAGFDFASPSPGCVESCQRLYIPRLMPGEPQIMPESGACDGLTTFACWGKLDYADGGTPVQLSLVGGHRVLVYATKEGTVTLVDADHLGTLYDRKRLVAVCGTKSDRCEMDWAGMIVTQPALYEGDGDPLIVVPTFMPDHTHEAGVFGIKVSDAGGKPALTVVWQAPAAGSGEARTRFRRHPSRATVAAPLGGKSYAFVIEVNPGKQGRLQALRVADGSLAAETPLAGPGLRFIRPAIDGDMIYLNSCDSDHGPGYVEAYQVTAH